jgi:hypothetical protein
VLWSFIGKGQLSRAVVVSSTREHFRSESWLKHDHLMAVVMSAKSLTVATAVVAALGATALPPPLAGAAPSGFPDVNAFTAVDPQGYLRIDNAGQPGAGSNSVTRVYFSTSDGVLCRWVYVPEALANLVTNTGITCSGNIPGIPDSVPANGGVGCARVAPPALLAPEFVFDRHWGACPPFNAVSLNAGQKIETGNTTCAVGTGSLIACIDPAAEHGFVLQPSGSWVF